MSTALHVKCTYLSNWSWQSLELLHVEQCILSKNFTQWLDFGVVTMLTFSGVIMDQCCLLSWVVLPYSTCVVWVAVVVVDT